MSQMLHLIPSRLNWEYSVLAGNGHANYCGVHMKYYVWLDADDKPLSKAWSYEDETERMVAEKNPPSVVSMLRAGTREQLIERYGLREEDFAD